MDERSHHIQQHIHQTRQDLRDNLKELEDRVKSALDWRTHFEEHPLTMLMVALGGGMLLAALLSPSGNGRRRREYSDALASDERTATEQPASRTRKTARGSSPLEAFKGAFMTAAASRIGGFLGQLLAGTDRGKRQPRDSEFSVT
jgi:hypothetical protein